MRPVDKGTSPQTYTNYQDARKDLANRIEWVCSYCEMGVKNMINVEHVVPLAKGGSKLEWGNFLLACFHCNGKSNKSDKNSSRTGYYWPDTDNTINAFQYLPIPHIIKPKSTLTANQKDKAQKTIDLLGLDKFPGKPGKEPTEGDVRFVAIKEAWEKAEMALEDWEAEQPSNAMLRQIVNGAHSDGHYSIWYEVFKNHQQVRDALIVRFKGTYKPRVYDRNGKPIPRANSDL